MEQYAPGFHEESDGLYYTILLRIYQYCHGNEALRLFQPLYNLAVARNLRLILLCKMLVFFKI